MGAGLVTALQARALSFSLIARTGSATAVQHVESQAGQRVAGVPPRSGEWLPPVRCPGNEVPSYQSGVADGRRGVHARSRWLFLTSKGQGPPPRSVVQGNV